MNTTLLLAQLWGPILLAVGAGMLVSRTHYGKVYHDIGREPLAALAFGILAMAVGLAQVLAHNVWSGTLAVIVTLLGWGTLLKGAAFVIVPGAVSTMAHSWARMKLMPFAAAVALLLGAYLSWAGYFA